MERPGWTHRYWVDSSVYGDVVGGRWDICLKTHTPLKLQCATGGFSMENTIGGQYLRLSQTSADDPDGLRRTYAIPYSVGSAQEIATMAHDRERRVLSGHIQLDDQSLNDIWRQELNLPEFISTAKPNTIEEKS